MITRLYDPSLEALIFVFAAESQCQNLMLREAELVAEVESKEAQAVSLEAEIASVRMTAAETQVALDRLTRRIMEIEKTEATDVGGTVTRGTNTSMMGGVEVAMEEMRTRARKYPELKAIAFKLKDRLERRAELLEKSMNETQRLKRMVLEDERRAKGFLDELERMRKQILAKNAIIKKLEMVALSACKGNV